jgi:hypothetical protein
MRVDVLTTHSREPIRTTTNDWWRENAWTPVNYFNDGLKPGVGRNAILEEFYDSNREWLCMVDDDYIFHPRLGRTTEFMQNIDSILAGIGDEITSFGFLNNILQPIGKLLERPVIQNNWVFVRNYWIGCMVFHRNTGRRYYYHPSDQLEEMDWCLSQLEHGQRVAVCQNVSMRDLGGTSNSVLFENKRHRIEHYKQSRDRLLQDWPMLQMKGNKLTKKRMVDYYWPLSHRWHTIPDVGYGFIAQGPDQYQEKTTFNELFEYS